METASKTSGGIQEEDDQALNEDLDIFLEIVEPVPTHPPVTKPNIDAGISQNGSTRSSEELQKELEELQKKMQAIQNQLNKSKLDENTTLDDSSLTIVRPKKLPRFSGTSLKSLKVSKAKSLNSCPSSTLQGVSPNSSSSFSYSKSLPESNGISSKASEEALPSTSKKLSFIDQEDIFLKEGSNVNPEPKVHSSNLLHNPDLDSSDEERERNPLESKFLSETGRLVKKKLSHTTTSLNSRPQNNSPSIWNKKSSTTFQFQASAAPDSKKADAETDFFSGLRIVNPKVSSTVMKARMEGRKMIKMSLIPLHMRGGDIEGDWVTIGVLVTKLPAKVTKTGKPFSIWKLSDLKDCNKLVSFFLFGEVHTQHWKTTVGSVLALLNPSFMEPNNANQQQSNDKVSSLKVDHPGKIMLMGTSKDMGACKAKRRNGEICNNLVNLSLCEFCDYHVKSEYKKVSSQRSDLQSSYSGITPRTNGLQDKLSKQQFFYGGKMVAPPPAVRITPANKKVKSATAAKDQLTLQNLGLKRKAEEIESDITSRPLTKMPHLTDGENQALSEVAQTSDFLAEKLSFSSPGSRTFLKYVMQKKNIEEKLAGTMHSITPKELIEMHKRQLQESKCGGTPGNSECPQIGRGLKPQDTINLSGTGKPSLPSRAKRKAIELLKNKGLLQTKPDSPEVKKKKVEQVLQAQELLEGGSDPVQEVPNVLKTSGLLDPNSERFQRLLNKKSSHANEVEDFHLQKEKQYFDHLEKKERLEEKMLSVTEIKCSVVSCHHCHYTAHHPAERCQKENHALKYHKAVKRFFQCKSCKSRTWSFNRVPSKPCQKCGLSDYERTTMGKPKSGPKLVGETLLIRGEERTFINS